MTSSANNRGFSRMGVDPTISGLVDGTDFPHSALFHALNIATQGSYAIIEGNDFDITQSDSSGKTQFSVAAGRVVRDCELQAALSTANFTQGTPSSFEEPSSGFAYYLLVVNSSNALEVKNNGGTIITDTVPNPATTDIPIAVLRLGSGETTTQRHVQFLTTAKKSNSVSIARENSGVYTEEGKITADSSGGIDIITTQTDEDIRITPNGNGKIVLDGLNFPISDGNNGDLLQTNGSNDLSFVGRSSITLSNHLTVSGNFSDVADKSAAYKRLVGNATLTALGGSLVGTDEVLIRDVSETNVEVKPKTVTAQTIADLYSETDTLDDVTSRGSLTANDIEVGNAAMNTATIGNRLVASKGGSLDANPDVIVQYVDASQNTTANQYTLPAASSYDGAVFIIKNLNPSANMAIVPAGSDVFEDNAISTDARYTSSTQLTLKPLQSVMLQAVTDSIIIPLVPTPNSLATGWMILETDTGGSSGLANVVDDTSPQLGGNLDTNSNHIDFDDAHGIRDSNSNEQLIFQETSSAVNYLEITNAATSNDPKFSAAGGDTNIGIEIETKGTGDITLDGDVSIDARHTFRATTLPVVDINSDPNPLVLATHAGRYLLCSSDITLPSSSTQGDQYYILNDSASSISIQRNGNNINGAASDVTLTSYKGATCIAIGSNNWIVLGV